MNNEVVLTAAKARGHKVAITALWVAILSALSGALAGFGHRLGFWHYQTGFVILAFATYVAIAAGVVCIAVALLAVAHRQTKMAMTGLAGAIVAGALVLPVWSWERTGERYPPIHDITTDTRNPPQFVSLLPLRRDAHATDSAVYGGPKVAAQQKAAYPFLHPIELPVPPVQALADALETARSMGWTIIAVSPRDGRIEATDETFWFGFIDDIVIRVRPQGSGSRVDVRSESRVGRGDFGTNAARIRAFTRRLEAVVR